MKIVTGVLSLILLCSCATAPTTQSVYKESALTPGMTKMYIKKGETTQAQVIEIFGPPNIVTHRDDLDIWTYDKISREISNSGGYLTILLAGGSTNKSVSRSRSIMLIVYFDQNEIVKDYRLNATQF